MWLLEKVAEHIREKFGNAPAASTDV